ncbi:glutamate racemase [Lachnospiraceae bacterium NSJ-143]|nr:glutamate racemase [Lachnospiraceae bacterium NSJ-143]
MDNRPIGIFDSGVGGLTVTRRVMDELANEEIVYFGDTARVPYGSKSKDTITKFAKQDIRFLISKDVKAVVIACNTVSSNSLDELKEAFDIPVFGVVKPGAVQAAKATQNNNIGVIATAATVRSGAYKREILNINNGSNVSSRACPLFVPLAEEGWSDEEVTYLTAKKYLSGLIEKNIDTLVLGCTHYPLLRNCIQRTFGESVRLIDPAYETAVVLKEYLVKNDMLRISSEPAQNRFYVSDKTETFSKICRQALGREFEADLINIEEF